MIKKSTIGYHLGGRLELKKLKQSLTYTCIYSDPTEILYQLDEQSYLHIFDYGSIVFFDVDKTTQTNIINAIRNILDLEKNDLESEEMDVEINAQISRSIVLFDKVVIKELNLDIIKIIVINIAQSIALDYYIEQSNQLLEEIAVFTNRLEESGKLSIKGKSLIKYIGKVLNIKNKLTRNLYIFDSPLSTWDDKFLDQLNRELSHELDIKIRHKSLQENLTTISENLEIFKSINEHSHSSSLEWIIIILIAVEIANMFFDKLF